MTSETRQGGPTFTADELSERASSRRGVEGFNQIVCWSRLLDWRSQTLTPI